MEIQLQTPLTRQQAKALRAGDSVLLSGTVYTARDAAHKRMIELLEKGEGLPFDIENAVIYYAGPCPAKPEQPIGSCGPTTSGRMDAYAPTLIRLGQTGMIGKGLRTPAVAEAMAECGCVYFGAIGGAGALIAKSVQKSEVIAFEDLGAEAVRRLTVKDFPVTVIMDAHGGNLYESGRKKYFK